MVNSGREAKGHSVFLGAFRVKICGQHDSVLLMDLPFTGPLHLPLLVPFRLGKFFNLIKLQFSHLLNQDINVYFRITVKMIHDNIVHVKSLAQCLALKHFKC